MSKEELVEGLITVYASAAGVPYPPEEPSEVEALGEVKRKLSALITIYDEAQS